MSMPLNWKKSLMAFRPLEQAVVTLLITPAIVPPKSFITAKIRSGRLTTVSRMVSTVPRWLDLNFSTWLPALWNAPNAPSIRAPTPLKAVYRMPPRTVTAPLRTSDSETPPMQIRFSALLTVSITVPKVLNWLLARSMLPVFRNVLKPFHNSPIGSRILPMAASKM